MQRLLISTLIFCPALIVACAGSPPPTASSQAASVTTTQSPIDPGAAVKAPGEAKVGDRTKCPVMGHEFVVTDTSPKMDHEGRTYYFCCPGCVEKFKAEPAKYLKPQG